MGSDTPFVLFGKEHMLTMLIIVCVSIAVPSAIRRIGSGHVERSAAVVLAAALVAHELFKIWVRVDLYGEPLTRQLPLHLCDLATFLTAYVLWRRSYSGYEIAYFWGLCGSLPALITPDLQHGFPSIFYVTFFLGHGLVILGVAYATVVYGFSPTLQSIAKAVGVTLAYVFIVAPVNIALDTNYLYLRSKPAQATPMDYFGPWPWYILTLIVIGVIAFFVAYAPFALRQRLSTRYKSEFSN